MAAYEVPTSRVGKGPIIGDGWGRQRVDAAVILSLSTTFLGSNTNSCGCFEVPAGAIITSASVDATDMDSGSALILTLGDAGSTTRLITSINAQAAVLATMPAGTLFTKYATKTQIRLYVGTAAGTAVAGTAKVHVSYFVDPEFSTTAQTAVTP
jgi:hypothetical protein